MRLVFFIIGLAAMILTSRWLTLSESSPFAKSEESESVGELVEAIEPELVPEGEFGKRLPVPKVVQSQSHSTFDLVSHETEDGLEAPTLDAAKPTGKIVSSDSSGCPRFQFSLTGKAKNVERLVRAEYEVPAHAAEVLVNLKSEATLETALIDTDSPGTTILRVTADDKTQQAFCELLMALYPSVRSSRLIADETNVAGNDTYSR